jgi:hypothetical protein
MTRPVNAMLTSGYLINAFEVPEGEEEQFLKAWHEAAELKHPSPLPLMMVKSKGRQKARSFEAMLSPDPQSPAAW